MTGKRASLPVLAVFALLCLLTSGAVWAGQGNGNGNGHGHGNQPDVGPNVQVNDPQQLFPADNPTRNSTTLAVSHEGEEMLVGWDDFQGFCGPPNNRACPAQNPPGVSGYGFSTDGGATWTDGGSPFPIGLAQTAGHPWVDRGGRGRGDDDDDDDRGKRHGNHDDEGEVFYYTSRMRTGVNGSAGIGVHRGHFAAGTFVWDDAQLLAPSNPNDYYSRQAIAAAKDRSGAAYIVQSNIIDFCGFPAGGYGQIEVFRTHDSGDSWQGPVVVAADTGTPTDPNDPLCGVTGTQQVAPVVAVGPRGEVYVLWQFGPAFDGFTGEFATTSSLAFSRSLDGGVTFSAPQLIVGFNNMRDNPPAGYGKNRMNDQPRITVATKGRYKGRIFVTFYQSVQQVAGDATVQSNVSSQIYIMHSDNKGQTWSAPRQLTATPPPTGIKRFWPTASVRPGGEVDVVYLESRETQVTVDPSDIECSVLIGGGLRREGPLSSLVNTYWIQSRDGGITFSAPLRVSDQTSNWCTAAYTGAGGLYSNFGDYIGVASDNKSTFTVWPDGRNGFSDVFFAEIEGKVKK